MYGLKTIQPAGLNKMMEGITSQVIYLYTSTVPHITSLQSHHSCLALTQLPNTLPPKYYILYNTSPPFLLPQSHQSQVSKSTLPHLPFYNANIHYTTT